MKNKKEVIATNEMKSFVKAMKRFDSKDDSTQLAGLLKIYGLDFTKLKTTSELKTCELPPLIFRALEKFAKEKCTKIGVKYPV